jgi:hypothetical protein
VTYQSYESHRSHPFSEPWDLSLPLAVVTPQAPSPTRPVAVSPYRSSPALATEAATRDGSALDAYPGRAHARAEVRSRNSQILVCTL